MDNNAENVIAKQVLKTVPDAKERHITIKDTDGVTGIRRPQKVTDLSQEEKLRYDEFATIDSGNPLALLENTYNPPLSYNSQQIQYHTQPSEFYQPYQQLIQSPPLQSYAPTVVQQPPTFQLDTRFVIPNFLPTDDPIASLNTAMIFLISAYGSRYPPTNNQLRTSSNPRTQATIQNGQVTIQNVQGRQSQGYARNAGKNQALGARVVNTVGNAGQINQGTQFKEFFDSKEVNASNVPNKSWQESLNDESEVQAIKEIKKRLKESELQQQESLVIEAVDRSQTQSLRLNSRSEDEIRSSKQRKQCSEGNNVDVDIGPSNDSDIVTEVPHSNNDAFENVFAHGIQSHELPESIPDTHEVNEYNSNIISDIPNMDPDRDKEEHDDVDYEQQHAFFASLINNLKCDDEKYNEVNREAQQMNTKLLNDGISNLKFQACKKGKTFAKENEKYDEYVQPLLKRKNELEKKNQEFLKQINDLEFLKGIIKDENISSDKESSSSEGNNVDADIGPSNDNDIVTEVPHSNNDTFEDVFDHGIQRHELPKSIPDTYEVNENNTNIIFDIPNMDPDRDKEEHDDVDYEQQHKTIESEYYKKIKLLNDEISNLKSQACEKDKTFAKENEKYYEYVQPLLKRKNELENKNQEFLKQINDLDIFKRKIKDENRSSDKESNSSEGNNVDADIGPSNDNDTVTEVPHSNNDTFENVFAHGIQSYELPESIPDTYEVNKNNSNIIFDILNMDPDRDKEEHDDEYYEQQHAFFASLINNLKCDVEKYNEVNREAQQVNVLLRNELERYK
ncbi:hypothetical protein Tco_0935468, partial [Tanacetum coccineum]